MDQKEKLFEPPGEFFSFPFFVQKCRGFGGTWGRLFWVTFWGAAQAGAKKVTGCRATPDLLNAD
ncbi:hypothetical protein AAKU67_000890 [Oxalobacteraceae bacterium GrIS 2.11]